MRKARMLVICFSVRFLLFHAIIFSNTFSYGILSYHFEIVSIRRAHSARLPLDLRFRLSAAAISVREQSYSERENGKRVVCSEMQSLIASPRQSWPGGARYPPVKDRAIG